LLAYSGGQKVARQNYNADPARAVFKTQPLVVLTNRGTANAAEVAAAALADSKRAEVVGERSYGDAAIRRAVTMDDGSAVIMSVAKFYSPAGKAIQDNYVVPSVLVQESEPAELDDDDPTPPPAEQKEDDQILKKAVELLAKGSAEPAKTVAGPAASDPLQPPARQSVEQTPLVDKNKKK
jgi:carboxyl-terminal processing protease